MYKGRGDSIIPKDVVQIFRILREEIFKIWEVKPDQANLHSFPLSIIPCSLSDSSGYAAVNNFKTILNGATSPERNLDDNDAVCSIIELVSVEGSIKTHSYIVTPLKFKGIFSNLGNDYWSYCFLRVATSGYSGTGPDIQEKIQEAIDQRIPVVRQREDKVRSIASLEAPFYERGPILKVFFPHFEIPIGNFEDDNRFVSE